MIHQDRRAEIGDPGVFIDDEWITAGKFRDRLFAVQFRGILFRVASQEHQPIDQAQNIAALVNNGNRGLLWVRLEPRKYLATGNRRGEGRNIYNKISRCQRNGIRVGQCDHG